jgi:hypothetical protein
MFGGALITIIGMHHPSRHPSESWDIHVAGAAISTGISQLSLG